MRILELIDANGFETHFQPIYSARGGKVYGYEALSRVRYTPGADIGQLFRQARLEMLISPLDVLCRENALRQASKLGLQLDGAFLFVNVCPDTIIDPAHREGITDEFAEEYGISKDKIILEITEEAAIDNYNYFKKTMFYYRERGYKIAIDDFGAGYGGLKMLSIIEPDFVKIDRHFVQGIDKSMIKFNLVDSIASVCHRLGIKIIAEGIEKKEECLCVLRMGIELMQGYYLHTPAPLPSPDAVELPLQATSGKRPVSSSGEQRFIGDISRSVRPIDPSADISAALRRFLDDPDLLVMPVVKEGRLLGVLRRGRFVESKVPGRIGYGMHLNSSKKVAELMEQPSLMVEANVPVEEAAQRLQARGTHYLYDDICVLNGGVYTGIVAISDLIEALTERSIILARGANPLTGLPGNEFIQRGIETRLSQNVHFDVCYIDINLFKPYNDHYGFERGDMVIKTLSAIIGQAIAKTESYDFSFVGHIGGDDFIAIMRPQASSRTAEIIAKTFESAQLEFHGQADFDRKYYAAQNRRGEEEIFALLSLSIGIVSTEFDKIESYAQLASIATEVKKAAKKQSSLSGRSSIVKNRRVKRLG